MFPLRGIGTMPFPSAGACALAWAHAVAGSEAIVAPDTAVLSKSRRVKLFIADRVYSRTIILQTFSRARAASFANRGRFAHHYCFVLLATAHQGKITRRPPRSRSTSPLSVTKRQDYCSFLNL